MKTSFRKSFARDLKNIKDQDVLDEVARVIEEVENTASPTQIAKVKKMAGTNNCFRIRLGEYRIGIVVESSTVEFVRCLPRRDLYRYFP